MTPDRRVVPFRRWHYEWLDDAPAEGEVPAVPASWLAHLEGQNSWTAVVDGNPVCCAGTMAQWPGRHIAWAYVKKGVLPHMDWITEEVRKNLEGVVGRIEFTVRRSFPAGIRWAKQLGFEVETPVLRAFGPAGEDHVGFVRFNKVN